MIAVFAYIFFILLLSGFFISLVFFAWGSIDGGERFILSFGFSMIIVPFIIFNLNLIHITITAQHVLLQVLGICIICLLILVIQSVKRDI